MTKLSVNLNKVAIIRNTRTLGIPSVLEAAHVSIKAGAHGITVHPRPDQRHIRYSDVYELKNRIGKVEFNIEGNPFTGRFMEIVRDVRPDQATLVADDPAAFTSDHGWDLKGDISALKDIVTELKELGIRVSMFMDPDPYQLEKVPSVGPDRVELYTEPYASAFAASSGVEASISQYALAAATAQKLGLGVNAGHDLNLKNLKLFLTSVPDVLEVSIGHALISDAIFMGLENAVKAYLKLVQ